MSPTRMTAGWAASFVFGLVVAVGWRVLGTGAAPPWVGAAVGVTAFTVTALFWPPRRRGRHRCR